MVRSLFNQSVEVPSVKGTSKSLSHSELEEFFPGQLAIPIAISYTFINNSFSFLFFFWIVPINLSTLVSTLHVSFFFNYQQHSRETTRISNSWLYNRTLKITYVLWRSSSRISTVNSLTGFSLAFFMQISCSEKPKGTKNRTKINSNLFPCCFCNVLGVIFKH